MDLCHLKHSEKSQAWWKYKGRVVFRGDQVRDEAGFYAVFSEQGTSASQMAAAKFLDALGRMPGNSGEDSDAIGAYTQVSLREGWKLLGRSSGAYVETWISLPPSRRPKDGSWNGIEDPVCKLRLNLYGHPLAGLLWEKHCQAAVFKHGFTKVQGWECLYKNPTQQLFLSIYVDDFKMAGNANNISPMWAKLKQDLALEDPVPFNDATYLGCTQKSSPVCQKTVEDKKELFDRLLKVDRKLEKLPEQQEPRAKAKAKAKAKAAAKPKPKAKAKQDSNRRKQNMADGNVAHQSGSGRTETSRTRVKAYHYDMSGHAERCVAKYEELANVKAEDLKQVATPCIDDHIIPPEDFEAKGELSNVAARIVLTVLFLARTGRPDLLWTVNTLARETTRWNVACDKRLHRLISYIIALSAMLRMIVG